MIVRVIGDGVVQVETPEAVKRCIRSGVPEEELGITREID